MRINLYGGAGSGKSTAAARVFGQLRVLGYQIELIHEFIKPWAYRGWETRSYDQLFVLANQIYAEDTVLTSNVPHLVTDAPLYLQVWYARQQQVKAWYQLEGLAAHFEKTYPALHVFLDRNELPYRKEGRYQDEQTARADDRNIREYLDSLVNYEVVPTEDWDGLLNLITTKLGPP